MPRELPPLPHWDCTPCNTAGREAAGITTFDGHEFHTHRAMGHVAGNFDSDEVIRKLRGNIAIGHNRYATTGETALRNVQPLYAELASGGFALCHNGNISNAVKLRRELVRRGSIFQSTSDTEVIIHLVATSTYRTLLDKFIDALKQVEGAYSLLCLTGEGMIACRDPLGVRPLVLGRLGDSYILASETVALDVVGATFLRAVEPGELIVITARGLRSLRPFGNVRPRPCVFEHVYFSRPDSVVDGSSVYQVRKKIGQQLAIESPCIADMVVPVPDSGTPAAIGFAQESGMPFELGIIRSHYVGRTFIQPGDQIRNLGVKLKHNANRAMIDGKPDRPDRRFDRSRHHQPQDRPDDARCGRFGGPHADRVAADPAQLLLRRRHPGPLQAAGRQHGCRADARVYQGRQPGVRIDRRPVPGARRRDAAGGCAAILRRLLHRRLPDPP